MNYWFGHNYYFSPNSIPPYNLLLFFFSQQFCYIDVESALPLLHNSFPSLVASLSLSLSLSFPMFWEISLMIPSVQHNHSVVSDSLWPRGLQHTRLPCPSPTPRAYSNSCPLSWWCHPTISSFVISFSSCLQSAPESGSFPMGQLFPSGGQSIGASASASVLPMNIQDWFPIGLTGWISLQSEGHSRVFPITTLQNHQLFSTQLSL